jgi:hypothetical protein
MKLARTFLIYILLSATSAYAVDWSAYGLGQVAETKQDKQTIYRLLDKDGRELSIVSLLEPTPAQLRGVTEFQKTSKSWTRIRIASINYVIYPSELEINVRVSGLVYKNVDLEPYVTAGIGLYFSESLRYAFRLSVNHTYPKVAGPYSTEEELCKAMLAALTLAQGEAAAKPPQEVPPPVFPAALLMPAAPAAVPSAVSVAVAAPDPGAEKALQQLSAIASDLAALKAENELLKAELDILRKAVLTLSNLGIFGDVRTVDSAGIQKILALKKEKPGLLQDEVADILRKENYKLTSYEIFLVFSVYFNEFR